MPSLSQCSSRYRISSATWSAIRGSGVLVLRGAGERAFISGADISEFEQHRASPAQDRDFDRVFGAATSALGRFHKPVLAMIHGYCLGGGLATALQADIRLAADDAQFGIPAARLGVGYRFGGVKNLVDVVGPAIAKEILFSGRRMSAEEALRVGLVNHVLPKAGLEEATRELAETISRNAPLTIRAAKECVYQAVRDPSERDLDLCRRLVEDCFGSHDYIEGRRAFLEKRSPEFEGR